MVSAPAVQTILDALIMESGISRSFVAASENHRICRCYLCLRWWDEISDTNNPLFTCDGVREARLQLRSGNTNGLQCRS